jgi:hypothetical protein
MGDRAQVHIKDEGVYLYTHWGASKLVDTVKAALAKKWRWDDSEYLARIIFCEMVKGSEMDETGFGIGTSQHEDVFFVVEIDCENQTVQTKTGNGNQTLSFEDFIK